MFLCFIFIHCVFPPRGFCFVFVYFIIKVSCSPALESSHPFSLHILWLSLPHSIISVHFVAKLTYVCIELNLAHMCIEYCYVLHWVTQFRLLFCFFKYWIWTSCPFFITALNMSDSRAAERAGEFKSECSCNNDCEGLCDLHI